MPSSYKDGAVKLYTRCQGPLLQQWNFYKNPTFKNIEHFQSLSCLRQIPTGMI